MSARRSPPTQPPPARSKESERRLAAPPHVASTGGGHGPRTRGGAPALALYAGPMLAVYAVFILGPLLYLAALSLMQWDGYTTPSFVGLDNYGALWGDPGVAAELQHSLIWLVVTLVVPPVAGLVLALLLAASPPRLRGLARAVLLVPLLLPSAVIVVVWRLFYNPLSGPLTGGLRGVGLGALAGDWLGDPRLALPALLVPACWAAFGLSLLVFAAALSAIDPTTLAAAQVDGAGAWARLRYITLPGLRGAAPLAIVATALCAVPAYDLVLLMTNGGPGYATTLLSLDMYGRAFGGGQVGAGAAVGCVQSLVGLLLAAVALVLVARRGRAGAEQAGTEGARPRTAPSARWLAGAALIAATLAIVFPIVWLIALVVRPASDAVDGGMWANLAHNIAAVWQNGFGGAFATSLWVSLIVAVATLTLAAPAAFALTARGRPRGRAIVLAVLALGLFQPGAVLVIPLFNLLKELGLLNSYPGVIVPEVARALPVAVLLLWTALRSLPSDVMAAAAVDGAAPRQAMWRVALPLVRPMLAVVGLWAFLTSWNEFLLPTVVLQDADLQTVPTALAHFVGRVDTQYALLAAGALLAIGPLIALYGILYGAMAAGIRSVQRAGLWR